MSINNPGRPDALRENPNFADVLRDSLACAIIAVDDQKGIVAFNPEAETITHLKADQLLGRPIEQLPVPLPEIILETFSTGKPITDRHVTLQVAEHGTLNLRAGTVAIRASKGGVAGVVVVLNDLTPARKLEQSMRRLDRLASIGTLSASMAHEIKNALVAVKTFVDLLREKNQDVELAEIVGREMCRIDSIVSQMLKFAGPARPTFSPVRLHEILDHSLRLVQHQLEAKLIALHRSFAASPDIVKGDDYQLEQAFINLFLNALEAMGPNGQLTVATEIIPPRPQTVSADLYKNPPQFRLTITDTGIGIPPENISRLFEPFFTTKKNGTGLGLPITRRIIQEHHGVISVESEPNKGTAFSIVFPVFS